MLIADRLKEASYMGWGKTSLALLSAIAFSSSLLAGDVPLPELAVRQDELKEGRSIQLEAYARYSGEFLLFHSREAKKLNLVYPYCISGNFSAAEEVEKRRYDGKRIRVNGTLLHYNRISSEPNSVQTFAEIESIFFKNWCFGPYVLRIDSIVIL